MPTVKHWEAEISQAITLSLKNDIKMRIHKDESLSSFDKAPLIIQLNRMIFKHTEPLPDKVANAITLEQLCNLPWEREFGHKFKPGHTEDPASGNRNYFGTSKDCKRIISVNTDYVGHTFVRIEEDGGTRCVFNGHVRSFEELELINSLVL